MNIIRFDVDLRLTSAGFDTSCIMSFKDKIFAIERLKHRKEDVGRRLTLDHIKCNIPDISGHISMLFACALIHGTVPYDFFISTVILVLKGKVGNLMDFTNYHGIALSSVIVKILDLIVLTRYSGMLSTSDMQFGFKRKRFTNMCSMILKETIEYYVNNGITVYCTLLDATKVFDQVEYYKLFRLLMATDVPLVITRVLMNMYTYHVTTIAWNGVFSDLFFVVINNVKQ